MELTNQLKIALQAIEEASKIVMDVYQGEFSVEQKEDHSDVTIADLQSDQKIREILMQAYPKYGMLSEETKDDLDRLKHDFCWIVDPLDGTKDFVNRTNQFSINIALSYHERIVMGVIAVPFEHKIYYAIQGQGAFKIENGETKRIQVNDKTDHLTLFVSNFFFKDEEFEKIPNHDLIAYKEQCGSSYKACKIAEGLGELCIKFDPHTKEWDTAPSEIIISEAKGYMCDLSGKKIRYNKKDVVNYNGFIIANSKELAKKMVLKK